MYGNANLAILPYLPRSTLEKNKKEKHSETTLNLPNRLLGFFLLSQKPFQAGTFAKFNPRVSF